MLPTFRSNEKDWYDLTFNDVEPYLKVFAKRKDGVIAECPICHDPRHLYVTNGNGKLLVYCHKCNADGKEILKAFSDMGANPSNTTLPAVSKKAVEPKTILEEYDHIYKNPDGSTAYFKHRIKYTDGSKKFMFGYRDSEGKQHFNKPEGANNLYNLDLMETAVRGGKTDLIYIVEGEKCADAMVKNGLLATTTNTGAQKNLKLSATDKEMLDKFKTKIVIPDNDDKGADYANAWQDAHILPVVSFWKECPPKGDVADYFEAGGTADKITEYKFAEVEEIDIAYINELDANGIIGNDTFEAIFGIKDSFRQQQIIGYCVTRAKSLGMARTFQNCWKSFKQKKAASGITSENMTNFPEQLFSLRCGEWQTSAHGVRRLVSKSGSEDFSFEIASPIPIMPTAVMENVEDGTERLRIAFHKNGSWKTFPVQRSTVASNQRIIELADVGIEVNSDNAKALVKYIADTVALNPDILPKEKSISHLGWYDKTFLPYNDDIKIDVEKQYQQIFESITDKGLLSEWIDYLMPLRKNLILRLIMSASFASPIIPLVNSLPFVFHLWGLSGSAKTVALMVSASIWGNPRIGKMVRTMNMTANSMMSMASILRNLPFFGDELQTIKSNTGDYDQLIMRICEGIDRGRMGQNLTLQKQNVWANAFIFTGEEPCTMSQSGGGVKNRVIEIECNGAVVENGNEVVNFITEHYGCAGKHYIERLGEVNLSEIYNGYFKEILTHDTTEKQAMTFALLLTADKVASEMFWRGEEPLTVDDIIPYCKTKSEIDPAERAWLMIKGLIAEHPANFNDNDELASAIAWGKITYNGECYFNITVLERELKNLKFEWNAVKKPWAERGYLKKVHNCYYLQTTIQGVKTNCAILQLCNDEEATEERKKKNQCN